MNYELDQIPRMLYYFLEGLPNSSQKASLGIRSLGEHLNSKANLFMWFKLYLLDELGLST